MADKSPYHFFSEVLALIIAKPRTIQQLCRYTGNRHDRVNKVVEALEAEDLVTVHEIGIHRNKLPIRSVVWYTQNVPVERLIELGGMK